MSNDSKNPIKNFTNCPTCNSENIYRDTNLWNCPECSHTWSVFEKTPSADNAEKKDSADTSIRDAFGNTLTDGDSISVIKELKIKGTSSVVKVGTKVKNIRLVDGADGHNISCKIEGIGAMNLKSEFVKKA